MSFDVFLQHFEKGTPAEASRAEVTSVLRSRKHTGPDPSGFYSIEFMDGTSAEFSAKGLESSQSFTGCAFFLHTFSDELAELVFDVACAGKMTIMPAMDGNIVAIASDDLREELPTDLLRGSKVIRVSEPKELLALLQAGFEGRGRYLDTSKVARVPNS